MTTLQLKRLADIRGRWMMWSAVTDTSTWETTLLFEVLDELQRELAQTKKNCT